MSESEESSTITRRSFLMGAGITAMGVAASSGVARASESEATSSSVAFDESYDVIVLGKGFAGGTAAVYAARNGAKVLVVDAAAQGEDGGNSRFSGGGCLYTADVDRFTEYMTNIGMGMEQDPDVLAAFSEGIASAPDILRDLGAEAPVIWSEFLTEHADDGLAESTGLAAFAPSMQEYPEIEGADSSDLVTVNPAVFDGALFALIESAVEAEKNITVWLESPATHLIQDSATKAILGVAIEHEGREVAVGANKGVVVATGGFECNKQMIQDYLGVQRLAPIGGLHNRGDGIRMCMEAGADIWHMSKYNSLGALAGNAYEVADGERCRLIFPGAFAPALAGAAICVAEDGSRFFQEDGANRHGHVYSHGWWVVPNLSTRPHLVFDEAQKAILDEAGLLPEDVDTAIVSADSAEELAGLIDADPEILAATIENFNQYATDGVDREYNRAPENMRAFEGSLYALPLQPTVLNTQGGPRKNAKAQVIGLDGNPIPNLFEAGECGGITTFYYQGAINVGECLVFGKIAGTNAAVGV